MVTPLAGLVMKTFSVPVGGGGGGGAPFETVTPTLRLTLPPAASDTLTPSVCGPSATPALFHAYEVDDPEVTCAPSTENAYAYGGVPPLAETVTVTVPETVAPAAGLVKDAVSGGGAPALLTTTLMVVLPVLPAASRTLAISGCEPLPAVRVSYGIDTGPRLAGA